MSNLGFAADQAQAPVPASERVPGPSFFPVPAGDSSAASAGSEPAGADASHELADAWRDFLGTFHWEWFCTLTFREDTHPESACKRFRLWIAEINDELYGQSWRRRRAARGGLHWVCAIEYQRRGVLHFHALVGGNRSGKVSGVHDELYLGVSRAARARRWDELAGFAKLDLIDDQATAVHGYVSKYVAKGGQIDLSANCGIRGRLPPRGVVTA